LYRPRGVANLKDVGRWRYIVLIAIGIAGTVYIWQHWRQWRLGAAGAQSSGSAGQSGGGIAPERFVWRTVNRPADGFRAEMPGSPEAGEVEDSGGDASTGQVHMLTSHPGPATSYSISWADDPPVVESGGQSAEQVLTTARDGALARTQTMLVGETPTSVQGFPAEDFTARNAEGGIFDARLILQGKRLYMLTAAFPSESARRQDIVAAFFEDFRLTAPAAAQ